ncbi:MAG: ABC transporter permease, partial [Acidobacteriota bacterium]
MRSAFQTPFWAVFQNELLLNSKRVAPYALILVFIANAVLWMTMGAAAHYGWAVNSDFYIVRNFQGFAFITGLPLFTAVIMGDCVVRDFRLGVDPLIFSKPLSRAAYLLGKFLGNFFVLACCLSAFALAQMFLQVFPTSQMVVLPVRVFPYFKHFFLLVVISQLGLAALYFTVGTLTRNAKLVYVLAVAFYPLYIAYQVLFLKPLPPRWRSALDPFLVNWGDELVRGRWEDAAWMNQLVFNYTPQILIPRAVMVLFAAACLTVLYLRFKITEPSGGIAGTNNLQTLDLAAKSGEFYYDVEGSRSIGSDQVAAAASPTNSVHSIRDIPRVASRSAGLRASLSQLQAAIGIELRLLRAEKGLVVLMPLAMLVSFLALPFRVAVSAESYSAAYAGSTARSVLLFLLGVIVFYAGEIMHRERELRVEPVLWSFPAPNSVSLLSKFIAILLVPLFLILLIGLVAVVTQLLRGHTPVELSAYLIMYTVILLPSVAFIAAASIALNVVLRDKYLAYAVSIAVASGLFYLYSVGYNHWLYNPVLYQLWTESDLVGTAGIQNRILLQRVFCLALTGICLALAHLAFR